MKCIVLYEINPTVKEVQEMMREVDFNRDGKIFLINLFQDSKFT